MSLKPYFLGLAAAPLLLFPAAGCAQRETMSYCSSLEQPGRYMRQSRTVSGRMAFESVVFRPEGDIEISYVDGPRDLKGIDKGPRPDGVIDELVDRSDRRYSREDALKALRITAERALRPEYRRNENELHSE